MFKPFSLTASHLGKMKIWSLVAISYFTQSILVIIMCDFTFTVPQAFVLVGCRPASQHIEEMIFSRLVLHVAVPTLPRNTVTVAYQGDQTSSRVSGG